MGRRDAQYKTRLKQENPGKVNEDNKRRCSAYYQAHREKLNAQKKAYLLANPEALERRRERERKRSLAKRKTTRAIHPADEQRREMLRRLRETLGPEATRKALQAEYSRHYAARNREKVAEKYRRWLAANPEQARAGGHARRARQANAEGRWTKYDIRRQYALQSGVCFWCDASIAGGYHIDHLIPLARGGSNWPHNLVLACPPCNHSKHASLPLDWALRRRALAPCAVAA